MGMIRRIAATLACFVAAVAAADSNVSAPVPYEKSVVIESFRLAPGVSHGALRLELLDPASIDEVKAANASAFEKKLQIGIGRTVSWQLETGKGKGTWIAVPGGHAAQWEVTSPGASAVRVSLVATAAKQPMEVRFAGSARREVVYGPVTGLDIARADSAYWSPVLEGEGAIVEVFVKGDAPASLPMRIDQLSHLFVGPWEPQAESIAKASGACQIDFICSSATEPALAQVGRAVAKMTFGDGSGSGASFLCTGTLLNPASGPTAFLFFGAAHCISTQASASTLTTHWFYERTTCGGSVTNPSFVQVGGGATLLYASIANDAMLMRLNSSPPAGAILAGWNAATLSSGTALTAVHHPAGDFKKVTRGNMGGFDTPTSSGSSYIIANWTSSVVEGGSSGSGIFTLAGSEYVLRGGLLGGPSSCTAPASSRYDYYSRFDQVYPAIAQYLNPGSVTCSYSLSPTSATVGSGASSGSVAVTTTSGCTWSVTSNATWLTSSSSGSGNGTVSYSIAANTGAARTGTLTIGGIPFTVTQQAQADGSTNLVANPGFETGSASWSQSATGGEPIIFEAPATVTHSGAWFAWLGGYNSGSDTLYQQVTIPSGTTTSLRFWYRIDTQETSTSTAYDTMVVSINSATTGARLATLTTLTNLNRSTSWAQTAALDVSAFAGQTVRLVFQATMDSSNITNFFVDDITLFSAGAGSSGANYTAMWWNALESGWGLNVSHQGNVVFATMFTYDSSGNPLWLSMSNGVQGSGETFSGRLYRTTGSAFNANPFVPIGAGNVTDVGSMTITFSGSNSATLSYTLNGVTVNKTLTKYLFGSRVANCTATSSDRSALTNYQDLWWNALESGWGLNITHQDNTLFVTMFNYNNAGQGVWWIMSAGPRQSDGSYFGQLFQTTGPPFNANPFTPIGAGNITQVGTMRLTFNSGTSATLVYTVNGVTVTKSITRYVLATSFPACS